MRSLMLACALGALLVANPAAAVPGVDEPDTVKVNAIRNPKLNPGRTSCPHKCRIKTMKSTI